MDYDLPILIIWLACCGLAFMLMWLWMKVDDINSNDDKIRYLQQENADIKKKLAQVEDLVLKNIGRRRG